MIAIGINYSQMYDSSACLVRDAELLFAVAEGRIRRVKHDCGFPKNAVQACLDFAKLCPQQIDEVCFCWQSPSATFRNDLKLYSARRWPASYLNVLNSTSLFASVPHQNGGANRFPESSSPAAGRLA